MSVRRYMKRLDDRTGRLERAINMVNDGVVPGILVRRGDEDKVHPQSVPRVVGLDRAQIKAQPPVDDSHVNTVFYAGFTVTGSNFLRPQMPALRFDNTYGTYTYTKLGSLGYSEQGYGSFGYGGYLPGEGAQSGVF